MVEKLKRITIITGHYGSGKTNLAVNLALEMRKKYDKVALVDLDIVNPYFRSADFSELMKKKDIRVINPTYANTNLDIPALTGEVQAVIRQSEYHVVFDVGGDDAGAAALGRYAGELVKAGYDLLYVVNCFRYLTREAGEALELLGDIQAASRLQATYLVNNSNLSTATTKEDILTSVGYANEISKLGKIPLLCHIAAESVFSELSDKAGFYPVKVYVRLPWEKETE